MSAPTKAEYQRLADNTADLDKESALHRYQIESLQKQQESDRSSLEKVKVELAAVAVSSQVYSHRVERLEKQLEEMDRRRWSFVLLFIGSVLTLIVNVVLFALKAK